MVDPRNKCLKVRSPRGATITEIDWADGHKGIYPHDVLRGYCPCAGCQGHEASIRFIECSGPQLELETIEPVGNYALSFKWFDGHATGLYSYRYLRALCQCELCQPNRAEKERPELSRM